jgi:hypothetical protein
MSDRVYAGESSVAIRISLTVRYGFLLDRGPISQQKVTVQYGHFSGEAAANALGLRGVAAVKVSVRKLLTSAALAALGALGACAGVPHDAAGPQPKPAASYAAERSFAAPAADR